MSKNIIRTNLRKQRYSKGQSKGNRETLIITNRRQFKELLQQKEDGQ